MVLRKKKRDSAADREQFVLRTAEALRAVRGVVSVTTDVADQSLVALLTTGDEIVVQYGTDDWDDLLHLPLEDRIARWFDKCARSVASCLQEMRPWEELREEVYPLVRPLLRPEDHQIESNAVPLVPFVHAMPFYGNHGFVSVVTDEELQHWGLSLEEVYQTALDNLRKKRAEFIPLSLQGLQVLHVPDGAASTRILLPELLAQAPVHGERVFAIPDLSGLLAAGTEDLDALKELSELADVRWQRGEQPISPMLYVLDEQGRLTPYVREEQDELALQLRSAERRFAASIHEQQRRVLEQQPERTLQVARYHTVDTERGLSGWCAWSEGVPALLPRTDLVALKGRGSGTWPLVVRLDDVLELAPDFLVPEPGTRPQRLRTTGWPEDEQLAELRAHAVSVTLKED